MNEVAKKGNKLWDTYFKSVVVVVESGRWTDPRYITGRYYRVKHPDGTVMDTHETAFTRPWLRQRDKKGKFIK